MSLIEAALRDQERRFTDLKPLDFAGEKPGKFRKRGDRSRPLPEKRFCKRCTETRVHKHNKKGLCRNCAYADWRKIQEAKKLVCAWTESPCKTKIAHFSKSGLCVPHGNLLRTRIANRNRRAKARSGA